MRRISMIAAALALGACATMDEPDLVAWLEAQGYSEVQKTGASNWFHGCSGGLQTATDFTAIGPGGKRIDGTVCRASIVSGGRYVVVTKVYP